MSSSQQGITTRRRLLPHLDSRQVAAALYADASSGAPSRVRRGQPKPPNHAAANRQKVREKSEQNRLAKLNQAVTQQGAPLRQRNSSSEGSRSGRSSSGGSELQPSAGSTGGRDFVRENAERIRANRRGSSQQHQQQQQRPLHRPGEVPEYLIQRKMELAQQWAEAQAEKERALIPSGMRIVEEDERLATLAELEVLQRAADSELQALPLVAETVSQRRYREQLEARMAELEEAIRIFRRPKVLVEV